MRCAVSPVSKHSEESRREEVKSRIGTGAGSPSNLARIWSSRTLQVAIGASIVVVFLCLGLNKLVLHDRPEAYDIAGYLLEANRLSEYGGVLAFPKMIAEGQWLQANQHPLYILAITPFAEFDFDFMVSAKLVNLFFGTLAVLAGFVIASRYFTPFVATFGVAGFALTQQNIMWSTLVACEGLLILLSILTMTAIVRGFQDRRYWIVAGFLAGAAYFTKVTALLLLPAFFLALLLEFRIRVFRVRELYLFVAAFLLAASPLLISNVIVHGNPIYNVNIDNLSDMHAGVAYQESSVEKGSMIRVYKADPDDDSASTGIGIGPGHIVSLSAGILRRLPGEFTLLLETLAPWPLHTTPKYFRWALGLSILGLFLVGVLREPSTGARNYMLLTVAVFVLALSLHRPLERYLLPIHFYIWVYAAMGLAVLLYRVREHIGIAISDIHAAASFGIAVSCALLSVYVLGTKNVIAKVPDSVSVESHRLELVEWMRANLDDDDMYVEGPNWRWVFENGKAIYPPEQSRASPEAFQNFINEYNVDYVVAEMKSMHLWRYRGRQDRRLKFEGILDFDAKRGIQELDVPPNWTKVSVDDDGIVEYIVYEVTD